jgi:hypothetical protein
LILALAFAGCRTTADESAVKDDAVAPPAEVAAPAPDAAEAVVGLDILDNEPAVTMIPANANPESDWVFESGDEYWLSSSRGKYMTFSENSYYAPYQNGAACSGQTENPASACSVKPSKIAQACQRVASLTLKALMENEPAEYTSLKAEFGGGSFNEFGWLNDAHSDGQFSVATWQEPFIWRGSLAGVQIDGACPSDFKEVSGYLKWVSSVDKNGKCKSPSKGQFLALLKKARQCLEQNNSAPAQPTTPWGARRPSQRSGKIGFVASPSD